MRKLKEHYGKLTLEERMELDSLILEYQRLNGGPVPERKQIDIKTIKHLPQDKKEKLWEYVLHMIKLMIMCPDNLKAVRTIASKDPYNSVEEILEDLPLELAPFVMRYVWRKYKTSAEQNYDCGYVITTAKFAFNDWISKRCSVQDIVPYDEATFSNTGKIDTSGENGHSI